jgi:hypothetical protein
MLHNPTHDLRLQDIERRKSRERVREQGQTIIAAVSDPLEATAELLKWAEQSPQNWHDLTVDAGVGCARSAIHDLLRMERRTISSSSTYDHDRSRAILSRIGQAQRDTRYDWPLPKPKG